MTQEEQLVVFGEDCEVLLKSDAFKRIIENLASQSYNTFCNSDPTDVDKREIIYRHYRALVDLVNTFKQAVSVKDQILEKNEAQLHDDNRPNVNEEAP